ncbi:MAG: DegV family protein [Ruminococcaceae bacterium]|nr:DegV family protein [Oscillospiraceae bacterium]
MEKIKITCDSTCDLTQEIYEKYNVEVLPLAITLGEDVYRDGVDLNAPGVFDYVAQTGILPKTSAFSMAEYTDAFKKYTDEGYTVIHINLSSGFSSSHQNAKLAAEELGNVYAIDSKNLSSGSGHLVMAAAEMAAEGLPAAEIVARLEEMKERLDVSFVLQTLDYLKKGGRCSGVVALAATALQLRPEIVVVDGTMKVGKKYRGSMEKSITDYVKGRLAGREDIQHNRIFITHSYVPAEIVEKVKVLVAELQPFAEIIETKAGCTISSHCGPACLGVLFFKKGE